ncbi:Fic family protein [Patescibacteria group bacterium]|nr:Fic family protein [Patescibacteria group bacterium]
MKAFVPHSLPLKNLDWTQFVHLIGKANADVARFDGLLQSMQNPVVLLSPLTTQEAVLSSKIEGTQATLEEVLEFEADPKKRTKKYDDIQEILNYRKAMRFSVKELDKKPLCINLLKSIHAILLDSVRGKNRDPGNFRKSQVYIGKPGAGLEAATYIPPEPHRVLDNLSSLEKYINSDEKDVLVQLAIIHAQFEIIHPFLDGNGRMGRILMPLFLYSKKALSSPMLYLSAYFERNRDDYYDRLSGISKENAWEEWIIYFLNAVIEQSQINIKKAKSIHELYDHKKIKIVDLTHSQFAIKTLDFIFSFPIFNSSQFVKKSRIPRASAARILGILERGGVINVAEKGSGKRPTIYTFPKLLSITG